MSYVTYNCDDLTGGGARSLNSISVSTAADGDRSIALDGDAPRFFVFNASGTDAQNVTTHPFRVRPYDYSTAGVWEEKYLDDFLQLSGGTLTGALVLAGDPAADLQAVPRQFAHAIAHGNLIINPQFTVNQRCFSDGAIAVGTYCYDRWKGHSSVETTIAVADGVATISAVGGGGNIQQFFEDLPAGTYTINHDGTSIVWIGGAARTMPYTFSHAGGNLSISFAASVAGVTVINPILVPGSSAVPFVPRSFAQELALCQRYYCTSYNTGIAPGIASNYSGLLSVLSGANGIAVLSARFPVAMRASPSITIFSPSSGSSGYVYDSTADIAGSVLGPGCFGFFIYATGLTANSLTRAHFTADAEL